MKTQKKFLARFKKYFFIIKRFNLYIELYYELAMKKYAMFNNCNVLIKKNKY